MRSAAAAFAWEFRQRLRWGVMALAAYLLVLATVQFLLGTRSPIRPSNETTFAFTVIVPLTAAFFFLLAVFTNGLAGDLSARQSMYPARTFTLPMTTAALAGLPMLYGSVAMAGLWLVGNLVALRPAGVQLPLVWPALFGMAFLAWMQAFTWMPYGLPGLRVIVAVLWLFTFDAIVLAAIECHVRQSSMVALLAPQVPIAYLAAWFAVARARRGDVPDWRGVFTRRRQTAAALPRRAVGFRSPTRAQAWFEWREHGRSLPAWVAIVLPFALALAYLVRREPPVLRLTMLAAMLLTPPFVAAFVALTVGRSHAGGVDSWGLTAFTATRPLSTARLVGAKLRMAAASTLLAWLLVALAVPLGLTVSGTWPIVLDRARQLAEVVGAKRAVAMALLVVAGLLAWTWRQLVQGLAIGLTGREGLVKGSVLLRLSLLVALGLVLSVLDESRVMVSALWNGVPWILAVLVVLKMSAAAWVAVKLSRHRLLEPRASLAGAATWLGVVLALYGVLAWVFATPHIAHYFLLLIAVLAVPLLRPSAATLALAWNRHGGTRPASATTVSGVLPAALVLFALPLALAVGEAAAFHVRNRNNGTLTSSGQAREYLLYVPKSYDPTRPTPLVISMHGAGMWPAAQKDTSQWNAVADQHGFIVVYPSGIRGAGPRVWRTGSEIGGQADVRFISDLIDTLEATYNVDPRRVYADGLSNGGGMAFVLSCTLSDRIAAVGLVASAQLLPWSWCTDDRPVPMIAFHGTADRFTPYHGGTSWVAPAGGAFADIPTWTANWARRNRCDARPVESRVAPDVTRREYTRCTDEATVALYTIHEGGHTWPGGGPLPEWFAGRTSRGVVASREEWAFFQAHPLVRESWKEATRETPAAGRPGR